MQVTNPVPESANSSINFPYRVNNDRDLAILKEYVCTPIANRLTLKQLGSAYGLGSERVRQIVNSLWWHIFRYRIGKNSPCMGLSQEVFGKSFPKGSGLTYQYLVQIKEQLDNVKSS